MTATSKRLCTACKRFIGENCTCRPVKKLERRGSANERGYTYAWQQASKRFLKHNPLCVRCLEQGHTEPSTVVDHVVPHRGNERLFWDESNWAALCKPHHDLKTGKGQ